MSHRRLVASLARELVLVNIERQQATLVAQALGETGTITVLDPDDLGPDDFVIPTAMMGAPTVLVERLPRGNEPVDALRALESFAGRTATATMPIECGGINSTIPLFVAARTELPVVDVPTDVVSVHVAQRGHADAEPAPAERVA